MLKNFIILVIVALLAMSIFFYLHSNQKVIAPATPNNLTLLETKRITIGKKELTVEIADNPEEQVQGLSDRESLRENNGMLFIFEQPIIAGFWMKDMKFSLDIIWIDENGMIIGIEKNVSPQSYPQIFSPPSPIKYVLEVNSGWSDRNNIKTGDLMSF